MKKYVETIGKIIGKQVPESPDTARKLLNAAYTWVCFSGKHTRKTGVQKAYKRLTGIVAGTIVDSFRRPQQSVMVNIFMPCELLHALDIQPMFPEGISTYVASTACQRVFGEQAEAGDVPESFCSYHKTMIGMAESGVMPAPLMIANTTLACDANQLSFRRLSDFYQVPHCVIDVPNQNDEDAVHYVADQLREFASMLEDLTHTKLDGQKLRESMARSQRTLEDYRSFLEIRGKVSLPVTMTGELCSLIATHVMLGHPESERYMQGLLKGARSAPEKEIHQTRRVFWMHVLPNWQDSMKEIFDGAAQCELVGSDLSVDYLGPMDPDHPYESMARRVVGSMCNGAGTRRIETVVRNARLAGADGVIVFCHWGCKQTMGLAQLAKETLEAEGFPTLVLDGDGCDSRNVADGQMVTRVNAFLEQLDQKHGKHGNPSCLGEEMVI